MPDSPQRETLSQSELDALIASFATLNEASAVVNAGPVAPAQAEHTNPEALDAHVASSDDSPLTQDMIDSLVSSVEVVTPENEDSTESVARLSEEDLAEIDAPAVRTEDLGEILAAEQADGTAPNAGGVDLLDQAALDALLSREQATPSRSVDEDMLLSGDALDELLTVEAEEPLDGASLDAPMLRTATPETPAPAPEIAKAPESPPGMSGLVTQDMIDALIAADGDEGVASAQLQAAAPTTPAESGSGGLILQDELDLLMKEAAVAQAERRKKLEEPLPMKAAEARPITPSEMVALEALSGEAPTARAAVIAEAPQAHAPAIAPRKAKKVQAPKAPRGPSAVDTFARTHTAQLAASLAAAMLAGVGTFTYLFLNQVEVPALQRSLVAMVPSQADDIVAAARERLDAGEPAQALALLEPALRTMPPGDDYTDALYLRARAQHALMPQQASDAQREALIDSVDQALAENRAHADTPMALRWRAEQYDALGMPFAATEAYRMLLEEHPGVAEPDFLHYRIADLALQMNDFTTAGENARMLLQQFPASPYAAQAQLILADAYEQAGLLDEARVIYARLSESQPNAPVGAMAARRLGRILLREGRTDEAILQLQRRLQLATTTEGTDEVYLDLAAAYSAAGRYEDARNTLGDLLNFFPDSLYVPEALVALSRAHEALGQREEALRLADEAVQRFPEDPATLRYAGEIYGLEGRTIPAAQVLLAAEDAGARDPALVLTAARHLRTAGLPDEALNAYALLRERYPRTPQAATGGIEEAETLYEKGEVREAVARLEDLTGLLRGQPQQVPALAALARMYGDLGLDKRVGEIAVQLAAASTEPEVRAQAARQLLRAGKLSEAESLLAQINLSAVRPATAYDLLIAHGEALRGSSGERALDQLERAYLNYPEARTADGDYALLQAYLAANRTAAARRMVLELDTAVRANPVDLPRLVDAAVDWGDHLYARGDYRAAADAYALAIEPERDAAKLDTDGEQRQAWAQYQRANSLFSAGAYQECYPLLRQIAKGSDTWAGEAAIKANYARLELRLRGLPVPEEAQAG